MLMSDAAVARSMDLRLPVESSVTPVTHLLPCARVRPACFCNEWSMAPTGSDACLVRGCFLLSNNVILYKLNTSYFYVSYRQPKYV